MNTDWVFPFISNDLIWTIFVWMVNITLGVFLVRLVIIDGLRGGALLVLKIASLIDRILPLRTLSDNSHVKRWLQEEVNK